MNYSVFIDSIITIKYYPTNACWQLNSHIIAISINHIRISILFNCINNIYQSRSNKI